MSFEWFGNHAILYDGHILNLTPNNEWAVDDAICAYEQKKAEERKTEERRIRQMIREEVRKELSR